MPSIRARYSRRSAFWRMIWYCTSGCFAMRSSARIAVEAVAGVNVEMDATGGIVSAHGVCDGAARFLCRRMDELSCGFVEDEQVVILIDDRKR